MRFLSALRRACPISVQQQQQCQQQRVNALWRAYLISTARKERGISHEHAVSMPYIGLLPFLRCHLLLLDLPVIVSMPYIGLLPFLQRTRFTPNMYLCVSMPYIGLLPFLPCCNKKSINMFVVVSMPYIGLLPFLRLTPDKAANPAEMCQCPTSGFSHFYLILTRFILVVLLCQCPTSGFSHFYSTL